ncbi:hypothetical protein ZWY2020_055311 [Hordeum vulgare]|nr:hypothetical protein ZWY2020_055311 [Hordeum vulgare]
MVSHGGGEGCISQEHCHTMSVQGVSRTLRVDEISLLARCGVMVPLNTRLSSGWHMSLGASRWSMSPPFPRRPCHTRSETTMAEFGNLYVLTRMKQSTRPIINILKSSGPRLDGVSYENNLSLLELMHYKQFKAPSGSPLFSTANTASWDPPRPGREMGDAVNGDVVCGVCLNHCYYGNTGSSFNMYVWEDFKNAGVVPCNRRVWFNNTTGRKLSKSAQRKEQQKALLEKKEKATKLKIAKNFKEIQSKDFDVLLEDNTNQKKQGSRSSFKVLSIQCAQRDPQNYQMCKTPKSAVPDEEIVDLVSPEVQVTTMWNHKQTCYSPWKSSSEWITQSPPPKMRKQYCNVPIVGRSTDCGIFTLKLMGWCPSNPIPIAFSAKDIPNARIRYAVDLMFSPYNKLYDEKKRVKEHYL